MKVLTSAVALALAGPVAWAQDSSAARQYQHTFEIMSQERAEELSRGGVVLHVGEGFSLLLADTLNDRLIEKGYRSDVALGGPDNELRLIIDGKSGSRHFNFEEAFTYLTETVDSVAGQELRRSQE